MNQKKINNYSLLELALIKIFSEKDPEYNEKAECSALIEGRNAV